MVEPFSSVVYNTLLSGRSKLNSVVRTVATFPPRSSIGPNFFTPEPRRVKGKNKLEDVVPEAPLDQSLREWSSSSSRHLFWWPFRTHLMMLDELSHDEKTAPSKTRPKRPPKPRPRIMRPLLMSPHYAFQRRNVSHATESDSESPPDRDLPSTSEFSKHEQRIQRFQRITQLPRSEVDLDHAWNVYRASKQYDLPLSTKMSFVDKYISAAELRYQSSSSENSADDIDSLGENALSILDDLKSDISPGSRFDQWRLTLQTRALALRGDYEGATKVLRDADHIPLSPQLKLGITYAYEMILTSIIRRGGNVRAMEYIGDQWKGIFPHIRLSAFGTNTEGRQRVVSLRKLATHIAAEIDEPLPFLEKEGWDKKRREDIGTFFIVALSGADLATEGLEVFSAMQRLNLDVPRKFQFMLIRSLARRNASMSTALDMYKSIYQSEKDLPYLRLGVYLYARKGDIEALEDCFNKVKALAAPGVDDIASLIHGYAMTYDVKRAEETFEEFFPCDENGKRTNSPRISHYAAVINAHARKEACDQKRISFWLKDLANADMVPNEFVFTIVLNAFAAAGDFESTMALLGQMREAGIRPNVVTYTIVITLLAHRKDPVGAEAVFKRALKEGVTPDNRMIVALMNAHVEGGSWQGVIRAYDYLMAARVTAFSLEVYNTLMKAYVLIGAPFNIVYKFFKRLERTKVKPDAYTYSLLVQSACDAGLMKIAADIYYDMRERRTLDRNLDANVYILTILMAGFLQHGDNVRAQKVYREMLELGINPSPITYRAILQAYGNERSKKSLEIAEQFIKSLVAVPEEERTWKKPKYDSLSALHHLYGPVIHGWARMQSPEDVERVFQDLQNSGGTPSIGTLTALMDVYRRTFNIDAVREIWPSIQELGLKFTSKDWMTPEDGPSEITRGIRGNILCVPLSIYIDALSAAGEHSEIAGIWKDLRGRGFSFDSHNWNHLSVAMVRAGEVERAFEVIERVIIPYQELSINSRKMRDRSPSSPLLSDALTEGQEEEEEEVPSVPAVRSVNRQTAAKISRSRTRDMEGFQIDEDHNDDFAYHLHILHQISPSWATWKAHKATLSVLLMAFNSLHDGRLVRPTGTTKEYEDEDESSNAREMLHRIYSKCPKTIQLVLEHDEKEREMLTSEEYNERYNLG
ncbi:hypothetical protein C0995_005420 [Termitomyces sp. Mi166|nr:hypothetical protein C0995_005420 [Termitomyces sp. Mi166\